MGGRDTVGGLAAEFFDRNRKYYVDKSGPNSDDLNRYRNGLALAKMPFHWAGKARPNTANRWPASAHRGPTGASSMAG